MSKPLVSIIIPMYNEEATIGCLLSKLTSMAGEFEIIVVDDASVDMGSSIVEQYPSVRLVVHDVNLGKADAIQSGLKISTGEVVLIQDADLEYPHTNIPSLIAPIINREALVVYGRRRNVENFLPVSTFGKIITSSLISVLFGKSIFDVNTGHKVFKKSCIESLNLKSKGFCFCAEVTIKLIRNSINILEVPIDYYPRTKKDGKKISIFDGFKIVRTIFTLKLRKS